METMEAEMAPVLETVMALGLETVMATDITTRQLEKTKVSI